MTFRCRKEFTIERDLLCSFVKSMQNYIIVLKTALCIFNQARLTYFVSAIAT